MQRPKKCPALPTSPSSTPTSGQCRPYPVQERQGWEATAATAYPVGVVSLNPVRTGARSVF